MKKYTSIKDSFSQNFLQQAELTNQTYLYICSIQAWQYVGIAY